MFEYAFNDDGNSGKISTSFRRRFLNVLFDLVFKGERVGRNLVEAYDFAFIDRILSNFFVESNQQQKGTTNGQRYGRG